MWCMCPSPELHKRHDCAGFRLVYVCNLRVRPGWSVPAPLGLGSFPNGLSSVPFGGCMYALVARHACWMSFGVFGVLCCCE